MGEISEGLGLQRVHEVREEAAQRQHDRMMELEEYVTEAFYQLGKAIHMNAAAKGFWDDVKRGDVRHRLSLLMLIATEVAEAAEAVRKGDDENFAEELADIVIRVLDVSSAFGIPIGQEIIRKMGVNRERPRKHGKLA